MLMNMMKDIGEKVFDQIQGYYRFHEIIKDFFEKGYCNNTHYINKEIKLHFINSYWIRDWKRISKYELITTSMMNYKYEFLKDYDVCDYKKSDFGNFSEGMEEKAQFVSKTVYKIEDFDCLVDESTFNSFKIFNEKHKNIFKTMLTGTLKLLSKFDYYKMPKEISCIFYESMFILLIKNFNGINRVKILYKGIPNDNKELIQLNIDFPVIIKNSDEFVNYFFKGIDDCNYFFMFREKYFETPEARAYLMDIIMNKLHMIDNIEGKIMVNEKEFPIINANFLKKEISNVPDVGNIRLLLQNKYNPRTIGLQNIGATCYMNATLQCLVNIKLLTNYLLNEYNCNIILKNIEKCEILGSYTKLLLKLCCDETVKHYFAPYDFKSILSIKNPLFQGIQANDSKDLIYFLLEQMNFEFNNIDLKINPNIINQPNNKADNQADQTNKHLMLSNFIKEYTSNNNNIITKIFSPPIENETVCSGCNSHKYNYQILFSLELPLESIYNKIYGNQYMNNNSKRLSIIDCISNYNETNYFTGENAMYCNICNKLMNCAYNKTIHSLSPIVMIILNRGVGNKFNCDVDFTEELNFQPFILNKNLNYYYRLVGVVTHFGSSDMGGHFIAYCKHRILNEWYCYNDASVTRLSDQMNGYKKGVPYILFYESMQGDKNILYENMAQNAGQYNNNFKNFNNNMNINMNNNTFNNNMNNINMNNFNQNNLNSLNMNNNQMNINMQNNMNNINNNSNMNSNNINYNSMNMNFNMNNNINIFNSTI